MINLVKDLRLSACVALVLLSTSGYASSERGRYPSYDSLMQARASVGAAQAQVYALIGRLSGGGRSGGDGSEPLPRPRPQPGRHGDGPRFGERLSEDLPENDQIAGFALQGLGHRLNDLGQQIDNAAAAYGSAAFPGLVGQACLTTNLVLPEAEGGRTAAAIPAEVLIHGFDFDPIVQELYAVKGQLGCF